MHDLLETRERMGVRTVLNTIETVANPADASTHVGSFYHLSFAKRLAETVAASETVGFDRVLLVQGLEGYDDVRPGETTSAEFDGEFGERDLVIDSWTREHLSIDDVAAESARITEAVLAGERDDAFATAIAQNAGLRIYAGGDAGTVGEDNRTRTRGARGRSRRGATRSPARVRAMTDPLEVGETDAPPVETKPYKHVFEASRCFGAGRCAEVETNWALNLETGLAEPRAYFFDEDDLAENVAATEVCPAKTVTARST